MRAKAWLPLLVALSTPGAEPGDPPWARLQNAAGLVAVRSRAGGPWLGWEPGRRRALPLTLRTLGADLAGSQVRVVLRDGARLVVGAGSCVRLDDRGLRLLQGSLRVVALRRSLPLVLGPGTVLRLRGSARLWTAGSGAASAHLAIDSGHALGGGRGHRAGKALRVSAAGELVSRPWPRGRSWLPPRAADLGSGPGRPVPSLVLAVLDERRPREQRAAALRSLGDLQAAAALEGLARAQLPDGLENLRLAAAVRAGSSRERARLVTALGSRVASPEALRVLLEVAALGPRGVLPVLDRLTTDTDALVRARAGLASWRLGAGGSLEALLADVRAASEELLAPVRGATSRGAGRDRELLLALLLEVGSPRSRAEAAARATPLEAIWMLDPLRRALADEEADVRVAAEQALRRAGIMEVLPLDEVTPVHLVQARCVALTGALGTWARSRSLSGLEAAVEAVRLRGQLQAELEGLLLAALRGKGNQRRTTVLRCAGRCRRHGVLDALVAALREAPDEDLPVIVKALEILLERRLPEAEAALLGIRRSTLNLVLTLRPGFQPPGEDLLIP